MSVCTSSRVGSAQPWPAKTPSVHMMARWQAPSISASGNSRLADLPPSSITDGLICSAQLAMMRRAAMGPPVNEIFSTCGWFTRASPASMLPGRMESTPSGTPASRASRAYRSGANGVISAGLTITQLPAASAGATFIASEISGPFQVMTMPTTPIGSGIVYENSPRVSKVESSCPSILSAQPA